MLNLKQNIYSEASICSKNCLQKLNRPIYGVNSSSCELRQHNFAYVINSEKRFMINIWTLT